MSNSFKLLSVEKMHELHGTNKVISIKYEHFKLRVSFLKRSQHVIYSRTIEIHGNFGLFFFSLDFLKGFFGGFKGLEAVLEMNGGQKSQKGLEEGGGKKRGVGGWRKRKVKRIGRFLQ